MKKLILLAFVLAGCRSSILDDPTTTIQYSVAEPSHVKMTIENSYNTVIATPVDEDQQAGIHGVAVSLSGLTEGIYFYTVERKGLRSNYYLKTTSQLLLLK